MPIDVYCDCGRAYRMARQHAGKRFQCKSCGRNVRVPSDRHDDFAEDRHDDDWYEEDDYAERRPPRRRSRSRSRRRSVGMPVSVTVAIVGESALIVLNCLSAVGNLISLNLCAVFFCGLRIAFEVACIVGFTKRQSQARWASIILSGIGLAFFLLLLVVILANHQLIPQLPAEVKTLAILMMSAQIVLFGGMIVTLVMPSAAEYLDR